MGIRCTYPRGLAEGLAAA